VPFGLPNLRGGFRELERKVWQDVVMQHQNQQQVQLHHGQQPSGCSTPRTRFQEAKHNFLPDFGCLLPLLSGGFQSAKPSRMSTIKRRKH
jgi:hypothetical protein